MPWWLLSNGTETIRPRTSEQNYFNAVNRWFDVLLPKIKPHLYKNGGKIITVQVTLAQLLFFNLFVLFFFHALKIENEYGNFNACDSMYLIKLRDLVRNHLGKDVVYFTTGIDQLLVKF